MAYQLYLSLALVSYAIFRFIQRVVFTVRIRERYGDIPQLSRHWLWGNLQNMGPKMDPSRPRHPDYGFEELWEQMGQPPCFLMDLAPVDRAFLVVAHPDVAESIVQPSNQFKYSLPKSDTYIHNKRLIGSESLITQEGEAWKNLRRRFNPGFQPKYLNSLAPAIISKTQMFVDRLRQSATTGDAFRLGDYAKDLTTDIITQLAIERDLQAQSTPEGTGEKSLVGILTASRRLSELCYSAGRGLNPLYFLDPVRPAKAYFYEKIYDRKLTAIVKEQLAGLDATSSADKTTRSISHLAMEGLRPNPELVRNTVHQIKSFLFAGQDTTATLVQWICYELSKAHSSAHHATVLAKLRAEHDAVFGAQSPWSALDVLARPGEADAILGSRLPYTTAFVKETLRLHPPAATARISDPEPADASSPLQIELNGQLVRIDGLRVYLSQWLIHRNPAVWGPDVLEFRPERWLDDKYMASLPVGSWRPFERGPRNCIGQELAMLEGKVVCCAVARGLTWSKVKPVSGDCHAEFGGEVYNKFAVTSVPSDGMEMRVSFTKP